MPNDREFINSLGMKFVRIEPGSFLMGSAEGGDFDERPVHRVVISRGFYLGACEVTNAQYERFDPEHRRLRGKHGFSKEDDEAVVYVTWHDATRFCEWLSRVEGRPYRLPTEAEWEYACRAGTTTAYHTGAELADPAFHKNVREHEIPPPVSLAVGRTPANPWGLFDVHGNVEEWCFDWYGPYEPGEQVDPVGRAEGDFRVTRGGSHSTKLEYLRSANRSGTLPEDKSWMIGFRVALGPVPSSRPLPVVAASPQAMPGAASVAAQGPPRDPSKPYFVGPRPYVKIPPGSDGPLFSKHNHDPAIVECPNGDLLAIWYTCRTEAGRELALAASRLRRGAEAWEPAVPFWDAPDRNDHAPALWSDGKTLYHFCGLSAAATWGNLAVILRTSSDSGQTWSKARLIAPEHGRRHQPVESVLRTRDGAIVLACDAVPGGSGGTAILVSRDGGATWFDPGEGKPKPEFREGATGAWIAGIHAGVVELGDGRLLAFGRGDTINGRMPQSISADQGQTWTYAASPFPPIGGGQRLVVLRLAEGPIFFASFAKSLAVKDASGRERNVSGLFAALSFDEGQTWPVRRLVTDDGPPREIDGGGNTGRFVLSRDSAEPRGYLSVCQAADGTIHLISSKQHYAFNLAWLKTPMP
ncbi:MAG: SUMF1/EgtB/PvdO family nonheme iron enzyme [Thermoguttaceae bacterium]|nr:SUMF1/EgtB/PvdO family nonheme iron enzyme [Thermoguttaceae bacterium]